MKPKKPRPRKPRERPDLRSLAAPPPADFYRLPELELRGGNLLIAAGRFARIELRSKWEVPQE